MKHLTAWLAMAILFSISLTAQTPPGLSGMNPAPKNEKVDLPAGVSEGWWATVQKQIRADEYSLVQVENDLSAYRAFNRAQGFQTTFTETGIRITPVRKEAPEWEWGISFIGIGRDHPAPSALISREAARNKISYFREDVEEWFINDERGLEQGFTIPVPPGGSQRNVPLRIDLKIRGNLHPRFSEDSRAVDFYPPQGTVAVLRYGSLKVTDATGAEFPACFEGIPGGIRIALEDGDAVYPVTVDPLATSASWTATGEGANNFFGSSVATAGDVNGDGYSDVIVGAYGVSSNTGKAYLYTGGPAGLSTGASWTAAGEGIYDYFSRSVATAGDVNGDGYSDVIVGAYGVNSSTGKAYLYTGGPAGLSTGASWTAAGEGSSDYFGYSVATAGDVNGDGYSDVIVGAYGVNSSTGKAYLYTGGPAGLSTGASWTAAGEGTDDRFGWSVATAGDVNGDGYSDVIVGAYGVNSYAGKTYLYYGNGGPGVPVLPRQMRADLTAPIAPLGRAEDGQFQIVLKGRTPFGRGNVKLEWQIAPLGYFYPGNSPIFSAQSLQDSGTEGTNLFMALQLKLYVPYVWRMRTRYNPVTTPFQPHGPWFTLAANNVTETDLRRVPTCVLPDQAVSIFEVGKNGQNDDALLNFQDPNAAESVTGYNVRLSLDPSRPKADWPIIGSNVTDEDPGTPDIQWTDTTGFGGDVLYYQVTACNDNCPAEGPF